MIILLAVSLAYALVQLEAVYLGSTDGYVAMDDTRRLELLASIATKAFTICTLYLAVFSVGLPSLHILTLVFTCLRMIELYAAVFLVSCPTPLGSTVTNSQSSVSVKHLSRRQIC